MEQPKPLLFSESDADQHCVFLKNLFQAQPTVKAVSELNSRSHIQVGAINVKQVTPQEQPTRKLVVYPKPWFAGVDAVQELVASAKLFTQLSVDFVGFECVVKT